MDGMDEGAIKIEDFEILLPPMFFLDAKAASVDYRNNAVCA
jgi:hypothetical protein